MRVLKQISFIVVLIVLYLIGMHELLKGIIFGFFSNEFNKSVPVSLSIE